jgi:hypothetical protein
MTTRQTTEGTPAPIAATLNTPTLGRAETPQGRSHTESHSRTADREARTTPTRTTPQKVSAVLDPSAQNSSITTRDNVPAPVQPPDPSPARQQPAAGAGLTAAIVQGAARSITARLVDKLLTNSPGLRSLWHMLPRPWHRQGPSSGSPGSGPSH